MEFRNLLINFILIGMFTFAFISWGVQTQLENNSNQSILSNREINSSYISISSNLTSGQTKSQGQSDAQEQEEPTAGTDSLILFTITKAGTVFKGMIRGIFDTTIGGGASRILGISPVIIAGIITILLASIILLIWSLYRGGR